jgi:hypothetical protein
VVVDHTDLFEIKYDGTFILKESSCLASFVLLSKPHIAIMIVAITIVLSFSNYIRMAIFNRLSHLLLFLRICHHQVCLGIQKFILAIERFNLITTTDVR